MNALDVRFASAGEVAHVMTRSERVSLHVWRDVIVKQRMPQLTQSGTEDHLAEQGPSDPEDVDDIAAYMHYSTIHRLRAMVGYGR